MEEAIIARLLADPGVTAIVGTRVHPGSVPQGTALPAIVFNRVDGAPLYSDDGEAGLETERVQIDCWSDSYSEAKRLARAVRASLSAFAGTVAGVAFQNILLDAERDLRERGSGAESYPFRTSLDFIIWHQTP